MSAKKPGRPTKNRQLSTLEMMAKCFSEGLSAPAAAKKAEIDPKTAYKYYDDIIEQYKERTFENVFQRQTNDRIQIIATFDKDLEESSELLDQIREDKQKYIINGRTVPKYLFEREIEVMKYRSTIKDRKSSYVFRLTPEEEYDGRKTKENSEEKDDKT